MAKRRLQYEHSKLSKETNENIIKVGPIDEANLFKWQALLRGPPSTPYEGGVFKVEIDYPTDYPFKPLQLRFATKIYHPNISAKGDVCVDILHQEWSPAFTTLKVLLSISSLLASPNANDPLNQEAARLFLNDRKAYDDVARKWVKDFAN